MDLLLSKSPDELSGTIFVTGSKSEANRLLILQALYPEVEIKNLSESDDTMALQKALATKEGTVDIHHAGTAMRFLTAYFASREGMDILLTGSERMQERPVKLLVDALRSLGADIEYEANEGFPPLRIKGKSLQQHKVVLKANVSSQYISALMLIAPSLPNGLDINLAGQITSAPYINMTLALLKKAGIEGKFEAQRIIIQPKAKLEPVVFTVESDWSSASYFFSLAALSSGADLSLSSYKNISNQGDAVVAKIYEQLGVHTEYSQDSIRLTKVSVKKPKSLNLNLSDSPDIAQTNVVTCFGLGISCELKGLHTLKIKETDRLEALKSELQKLGAKVEVTSDTLRLKARTEIRENVRIETYNDHRMAMAFAPLALLVPLEIADAGVVSKSYPKFWEDLTALGIVSKKA